MWAKAFQTHWNRTKSFLGDGYHRLGKWAGEMDRMAGVGRKMFALAAPILDDFGQSGAVDKGMRAVQGYDNLRKGVVDADGYARGHASRIASADLFS
jgi:hypothetical protein